MRQTPPVLRPEIPWPAILAFGGLAGAVALLAFFDPVTSGFYPVCPLHNYTGLWCPGCGVLRASHELFHAHWSAALRLNPLFVLALPLLAWGAFQQFRGSISPLKKDPLFSRPPWPLIFLTTIIAFGILRNIPIAPFTYLKP